MSSSYLITLPDGSRKEVLAGASPLEVARSIGARLADDAVVARVDGKLWDLARPFEGDATLEILTSRNGEEALKVYRHSTAHLLAAAVLELYPGTKLGVGPAIESGFYYDFERETPFTTEDLELIEKKMREIRDRDLAYGRTIVPKQEGLRRYQELGEGMKCELIEEKADEVFSEYTLGPQFIDFCRGPHVPDTSKIKAFKLLSIAGAYWKGDEKNKQLQRIYGTRFSRRRNWTRT
jgi:threonyl-tRNA synthetase